MDFLKRLFGLGTCSSGNASKGPKLDSDPQTEGADDPSTYYTSSKTKSPVISEYFDLHAKIQTAQRVRDYPATIAHARRTYSLLPAFVEAWKREYGRFDINSSVAVHTGSTLMAVMSDGRGVEELRLMLTQIPELRKWMDAAESAKTDLDTVETILECVNHNPGVLQRDLKNHISNKDGRRIATLVEWLEKAGRIKRERQGQTHRLSAPGPQDSLPSIVKPSTASHSTGSGRSPLKPRIIDLAVLPYIPLPSAPSRWEHEAQHHIVAETSISGHKVTPRFSLVGHNGWRIASEQKLLHEERPDIAFTDIHPTNGGAFLVAPNDRAQGYEAMPAALESRDRQGNVSAVRGLRHDVYRTGVNPLGRGISFMSRNCVLHAYDEAIQPLIEFPLMNTAETQACAKRLGIVDESLKNHLRCVCLSADNTRCLYTLVDEAWCLSEQGECLWGVRMPVTEGWAKVVRRSSLIGTSVEIEQAMHIMRLNYPISFDDIRHRHRELAKLWHPDLNPADPTAQEKMQRLNRAVEVLTGADPGSLLGTREAQVYYERQLKGATIEVPGVGNVRMSLDMVGSEKQAADWIYSANFGARLRNVFLGTYSGRVVEISSEGTPQRAYDIGTMARLIADTGDYLYILADTRLYVLTADKLRAVVDVSDGADLVIAQTGFGLLEKKAFRWFREDGVPLSTVKTIDPIRRVYSRPQGLVVETRQHRAIIEGAPLWWEY